MRVCTSPLSFIWIGLLSHPYSHLYLCCLCVWVHLAGLYLLRSTCWRMKCMSCLSTVRWPFSNPSFLPQSIYRHCTYCVYRGMLECYPQPLSVGENRAERDQERWCVVRRGCQVSLLLLFSLILFIWRWWTSFSVSLHTFPWAGHYISQLLGFCSAVLATATCSESTVEQTYFFSLSYCTTDICESFFPDLPSATWPRTMPISWERL